MPTFVKLKGLTRGKSAGGDSFARGFRVRTAYGPRHDAGVKANRTVGAGNSALTFTARYGGAWGNRIRTVVAVSGANTPFSYTITTEASSGDPVITVNSATDGGSLATTTAAQAAAALNADVAISELVVVTAGGTGAGVLAAGAAADLTGGTNVGTAGGNIELAVHSKATILVDVDDAKVQRALMRNPGKYVVLGQP